MPQEPSAEEQSRWHRRFAVECNNRAWQLADQASCTPAEDEEMLNAAHAAALHWARVGNPLNDARARLLLGHVHARLGNADLALRFASASHAYLSGIESPDWEIAFSQAVMAHAAAAGHDHASHQVHYIAARAAGDAIKDAEDRAIFETTFAGIPVP